MFHLTMLRLQELGSSGAAFGSRGFRNFGVGWNRSLMASSAFSISEALSQTLQGFVLSVVRKHCLSQRKLVVETSSKKSHRSSDRVSERSIQGWNLVKLRAHLTLHGHVPLPGLGALLACPGHGTEPLKSHPVCPDLRLLFLQLYACVSPLGFMIKIPRFRFCGLQTQP